MLKVHKDASSQVGHGIGPLDASLVKDMMNMGCSVKKVHGVVQYEKNETMKLNVDRKLT